MDILNKLDELDKYLPAIDEAFDEIKRLRELTEWRDIETAPKEKVWIVAARFDERGKMIWWERVRWNEKRKAWLHTGGWCYPNRWLPLPLPEPPQETK